MKGTRVEIERTHPIVSLFLFKRLTREQRMSDEQFYILSVEALAAPHVRTAILKESLEQVGWMDNEGYVHSDKACALLYDLQPGIKEKIHQELVSVYVLREGAKNE